jgi:hypothetical protein
MTDSSFSSPDFSVACYAASSITSSSDSPLEGEGFEPSVPRKRDSALRDCPFRFLGPLLDRPTFGLETCATLGTARRPGVGMVISSTLDINPSRAPGCSLTRRDTGAC